MVLQEIDGGVYDFKIGFDGDLETEDTFDSFIFVALLSDRRADESEVPESRKRRGWIGNETTPGFEQGSKLWLFEQAKLTRTILNDIEDEARSALQSLVVDGFAESIRSVDLVATQTSVVLEIAIERNPSEVESRFFELWNNTGVT